MAARSKRRRTTSTRYETLPKTNQARFRAPKRRISEKQPTWSAPSKYQQTITQMNPFHAIYHPNSESETILTDKEEESNYVASPSRRKRRRIVMDQTEEPPTRNVKTRSSARKAVATSPQVRERDEAVKLPGELEDDKLSKPKTAATLMPPPMTPRTWRKREIPSSQSPADSPLSTQSRRSIQDYSRSPLKERSTNVTLPASHTRKSALWAKKLEVEDSLEKEEDESPTLTRLGPITEPLPLYSVPEALPENERSGLSTCEIVPGWRSSGEVPNSSQLPNTEANISSSLAAAKATKEILDSDIEDDGDDDAGKESLKSGASARRYPPFLDEHKSRDQMSENNSSHTNAPFPKPSRRGSLSNQSSAPNNNAEQDLIYPPMQPSETEEASAQLFHDLQRATQPGGLQTESQYEASWTPYHPASDNPDEEANTLSPSPTEASEADSIPAPSTIPTQILPFSSTPFRRPVRPSQATTTDVTQPSPRKVPSSSSLAYLSSPPPMPPPLSSPSDGRKTVDPWAGFQWDGKRLTDSQLLPESLMNDSYLGPPGGLNLSQDDFEE